MVIFQFRIFGYKIIFIEALAKSYLWGISYTGVCDCLLFFYK